MEQYEHIRELARRGLSHAWLVIGESESAGSLSAFIASAMLCSAKQGRPCGVCSHCRKLSVGIHPDLIRITKPADKREIGVEIIRDMSREAYVRPNEADSKVFIIENAELLNASAQNAMLKLIEEPPRYAAFILIAKNPGSLFDTVRSRCVEINVPAEEAKKETSFSELGSKLAEAVLGGDSLSLYTASLKAEKLYKTDFDALLDELFAIFAVNARKVELRSRCIEAAKWVDKLREMRASNVSAGHCMGYLLSLVR